MTAARQHELSLGFVETRRVVMKAVQAHLSRWMLGYAVTAMVTGVGLGRLLPGVVTGQKSVISQATTAAVFLIIYPMMVNLRFEALARAGRNVRALGLGLVFNFVWAPLVGLVLARIFLHDPLLAVGFLLVMVVPCSSMTVAYTGLAGGDVALAAMSVTLGFVVAVVAVPVWMLVFAAGYHVVVPVGDMLISIATVLLAPMLAGFLTRKALSRRLGEQRFDRLQPLFPAVSMLAMFTVIFMIFFGKSDLIVAKWATVVLLLVPNAVFLVLTLAVATWVDRWAGLSYGEHMAVVFASTGKNNATAIAIAATAFPPMVAVPAATMPIFQVMLLVGYVKLADRVRARFTSAAPPTPVPV